MISGAIQYGVPTTLARLSCSADKAAANPKSASFTLPSKLTFVFVRSFVCSSVCCQKGA